MPTSAGDMVVSGKYALVVDPESGLQAVQAYQSEWDIAGSGRLAVSKAIVTTAEPIPSVGQVRRK